MNRKLRDRWATALRSRTYTQCQNMMRSPNGLEHCCLGVLADIQGIDVGDTGWDGFPKREAAYDRIVEQLGSDGLARFSMMNDRDGLSFDAIADAVDALDVTD